MIKEIERTKISKKCDLCKKVFDAYHVPIEYPYIPPDYLYDDGELIIKFGKRKDEKSILLRICPECAEKLLELLDKHFPRLNLEDKV